MRVNKLNRFVLAASALATAAIVGRASVASAEGLLDRPMAEAWPARREWTPELEARYSDFVTTIGRHVAAGECHTLQRCINDPAINPLVQPGERPLHFHADCADVPYFLRAYFSYRNGLPFAFANHMGGRGHDPRYLRESHAVGLHVWNEFRTPRELLESVGDTVHSGYLRTAPEQENSDFYQASVSRGGIRPGTAYYDPNGHVLVVYEVRPDGDVLMFDGHPDNSLSHPHFSERYPVGPAWMGGGFKNFRPIAWRDGQIAQTPNEQLADFAGASPFDRSNFRVAGRAVGYHEWVRYRLSVQDTPMARGAGPSPDMTPAGRESPAAPLQGAQVPTQPAPVTDPNARHVASAS